MKTPHFVSVPFVTFKDAILSLLTIARFVDRETDGFLCVAIFDRGMAKGWIVGGTPLVPRFAPEMMIPRFGRRALSDALATFDAHSIDPESTGNFECYREDRRLVLTHSAVRARFLADQAWKDDLGMAAAA